MKLLLTSFIFFLSIVFAEQTKTRVAILDFTGKAGISSDEAAIISDIFRTKLVSSPIHSVLDRANMNAILSEQSFQKTGCTESDCAVELGKLLNIQKMIYGSIGKLGGSYYIVINVVNIESGETEKGLTKKINSLNSEELELALDACVLEFNEQPRRANLYTDKVKTREYKSSTRNNKKRYEDSFGLWDVKFTEENLYDLCDKKYTAGLDFPLFGIRKFSRNHDGIVSETGMNYFLGITFKNYFSPVQVGRWNSYWHWGTLALIVPYIGIGTEYLFENGIFIGFQSWYLYPMISIGAKF